jgi:hypothetical protein
VKRPKELTAVAAATAAALATATRPPTDGLTSAPAQNAETPTHIGGQQAPHFLAPCARH